MKYAGFASLVIAIILMGGCSQSHVTGACSEKQDVVAASPDSELAQLREEIAGLRADVQKLARQTARLSAMSSGNPAGQPMTRPEPDMTVYSVVSGDSPVLGSKDAQVSIAAFFDYQCPYCPREYEKIQQIVKESDGRVNFMVKHRPLSMHPQARYAAAAAELAKMDKGNEGFWAMSNMLFANNKNLQVADLRQYAQKLALQIQQFDDVMADPNRIGALLAGDKSEAAKCKVTGTPTVLINGLKLQDRSPEGYKKRIDEILSKQATKTATVGKATT
jgi:protein-disulfide isomerase